MSDTKIFSIPDNNGGGNGGNALANGVVPFMLGAGMSGGFGGFGGFGGGYGMYGGGGGNFRDGGQYRENPAWTGPGDRRGY